MTYHERKAAGLCVRCGKSPAHVGRTCCAPCREFLRVAKTKQYQSHRAKGLCNWCGLPHTGSSLCTSCAPKHAKCVRNLRAGRRTKVIEHYGGKCACCGEAEPIFLELDHINNDGTNYSKNIRQELTAWAIRHDYPNMLQLLCCNCNRGKYLNGGVCPHQSPSSSATV